MERARRRWIAGVTVMMLLWLIVRTLVVKAASPPSTFVGKAMLLAGVSRTEVHRRLGPPNFQNSEHGVTQEYWRSGMAEIAVTYENEQVQLAIYDPDLRHPGGAFVASGTTPIENPGN